MCNEYVVKEIDGVLKWVRLAIGGGGQVVGDFDPEDPEVVQFHPEPTQHRYHILPDGLGPVIRLGADGRFDYTEMRWGFPPPPNAKPPRPVTNVRNLESSFWRKWLEPQWRCLVPVTSFCEWTDEPDPVTGKKSRRWFKLKNDTPFMFAGIWREWEGVRGTKAKPVEGKHLLYSFITTDANERVGAIHKKAMPVILTRDKWMDWLRAPTDIAKQMIKSHDDDEMAEPAFTSD